MQRVRPGRLISLLAAGALFACGGTQKSEPTPPSERQPAPEPPSPGDVPGTVSEESFAKLHTLREDDAPPRRGTMITLPGGARAYLVTPENVPAPVPAVIVIHEWWGLNQHIMHWADRLAQHGYAALAVDLYGGVVATDRDAAMAAMKKVDDAQAEKTLREAHQFLVTDERVKARRTGSIGWCFGGGWSLRLALAQADLDAAVVYYGHVPTDAKALAPLKAPLLGVFGNQDEAITPATVDAFEAALKANGARARILRYDAPHAFANPSSPAYHAEQAAEAWTEVQKFLAAHLNR